MDFFKKNINETISLIITFIIILILGTGFFELGSFNFFTYTISVNNIAAVLLFMIQLIIRNNKKTNIIIEIKRFSKDELFYMISYYLQIFLYFVLFVSIGSIKLLFGIVIISLELIIILSKFYVNYNQEFTRDILTYWRIKEIHLSILFFLLMLNNMPFEIYGLPVLEIIVITYIFMQANLIYKIYE